jgi:pyruvate kinase
MLIKMLDAGMNVARLNFSHGDHKSHGASVANLKEALK